MEGGSSQNVGGGSQDFSALPWNWRHHVCLPTTISGDRQTWLIVGLVMDHEHVDPEHFGFAVEAYSHVRLTGRETFARLVHKLLARGYIHTLSSTFETLRHLHVVVPAPSPNDVHLEEPSWLDLPPTTLSIVDCRRVLRRAGRALASCASRRDDGDVTIKGPIHVRDHPWVKYFARLRDRRARHDAVQTYRTAASFQAMPKARQRAVVNSASMAVLSRVRGSTELVERGYWHSSDSGGAAPAHNVDCAAAGSSDAVGAAAVFAATDAGQRQAGSPSNRAPHGDGDAARAADLVPTTPLPEPGLQAAAQVGEAWRAASASGDLPTLPERLHVELAAPDGFPLSTTGAAMRAAAPVSSAASAGHDRPKQTRAHRRRLPGSKSMPKFLPTDRQAARTKREAVDDADRPLHAMLTFGPGRSVRVWDYEIGSTTTGVRYYRLSDGTRKRLAAPHLRRLRPGFSPVAPGTALEYGDPPGMMCGSGSQEGVQDADAAPLRITKSTFLEFDDGSDREVVVGIEFDIVASLNLSFRKAALLPSDNTCSSEVHVTLAADGGPVRRTTLTVFTLTVSTSLMQTGRTPLIPILYLLSGEHAIHGAIGDRLRDRLKVALRASYYVPVRSSGSTTTTFRLKLPFILRLCGDFAMLCIFLTLTAGSDVHRCPSWWLCAPNRYMSGRLWLTEHVGEVRHAGTLSRHWELVIWTFARWCALKDGRWSAASGFLSWKCDCGHAIVARSSSAQYLSCPIPSCVRFGERAAPLLPRIAYTPASDFFKLLRRLLGGTRGYPLLGNIPFIVQPPVLHSTGKITKSLVWFLFALLSSTKQDVARIRIFEILGRSNMGGMYLREFGRLAAHVVADESALAVPLDGAAVLLLQLSQLLSASWRRAIGTSSARERECAAVVLQLTASILSCLFVALKPFDPETKGSGVFNLYLHTALAHVRATVGSAFPTANLICDDNIEGTIAELNRYFNSRTNNASRGESLVNKEALQPMLCSTARGSVVAERKIFTETIVICTCVYKLAPSVKENINANIEYAMKEPNLSVETQAPLGETSGEASTGAVFSLPAAVLDKPAANPDPKYEPSVEIALQTALQSAQCDLRVCWCGARTGRDPSPVGMTAVRAAQQSGGGAPTGDERTETPAASGQPQETSAAPVALGDCPALADNHDCGSATARAAHRHTTMSAMDVDNVGGGNWVDAEDEEEDEDGEHVYRLMDAAMDNSDDESDLTDVNNVDGPIAPSDAHPAAFLLQCAKLNDVVLHFLPDEAVVDMCFTPVRHDWDDAERLRSLPALHKMQEDLTMINFLSQRLRTAEFASWVEKDGVNVRDVQQAVDRLKLSFIDRIMALTPGVTSA